MRHIAVFLCCLMAGPVLAQSNAPIDILFRALGLPEIINVMRDEGLEYSESVQDQLLGGAGGERWDAATQKLYDLDRMNAVVRNRMDQALAAEDLAPMIRFFDSDNGRRIVGLEISARLALLDKSIEDASHESLMAMIEEDHPRLKLLTDFIDAGNLVDNNVTGAMNSNLAFYTGLATSKAGIGQNLAQADILADIWTQEPSIRLDTERWLYSYLNMAYQPLTDDELQVYTDFYQSPAGQALNHAIFVAFDEMFETINLGLGRAAAEFLGGQDL